MLQDQSDICKSSTYQEFKCARPLDFSYRQLKSLEELNGNERPWTLRVRGSPKKDKETKRYRTGSFWLNNNNLKNVNGLRNLTNLLFQMADYLSWLDVSNNHLTIISDEFLLFPNLSMLYLHRNNIEEFTEVYKLRKLNKLKTLTINNNPMCVNTNCRAIVVRILPELRKLDNVVVVGSERETKKLLDRDIWSRLADAYPKDFDPTKNRGLNF